MNYAYLSGYLTSSLRSLPALLQIKGIVAGDSEQLNLIRLAVEDELDKAVKATEAYEQAMLKLHD